MEYDKSCFSHYEIESIANGLRDLLRQIIDDSSKKCRDYSVEVVDFFKAENYYNNMINSFDNPTAISPDMSGDNVKFCEISKPVDDDKLKNLSKQYNLSKERILLSVFMFNLTKFSFSKDILVAYNKQACGYHFNTDLSVMEYLDDFKKYFKHYSNYPLLNNKKLNFKSEILFFTNEYDAQDYKFVLNYESGKINISYDESFYSKALIETFLE